MKPPWEYITDDDDLAELWRDTETNEERWVERDGPPLYETPADEIAEQPVYGPPED